MESLLRDNVATALRVSAYDLKNKMKQKIMKGDIGWAPLSPLTIERKGHSKKLQDKGELVNAIKVTKVGRFAYFVGLRKDTKNRFGVSLDMIGKIQEFGKIIKPKTGRMLAIPLTKEATRLQHVFGSVRKIPGLFKLKGKKILAMKGGKGGLKFMFVLMNKVKIKSRSFVRSTANKEMPKIKRRIVMSTEYAVKGRRYNG